MSSIDRIGLGTAALGRPQYINIRSKPNAPFDFETFKKQGFELLDLAFERGVRYFDTAPGYGMAEQLMIDWAKKKQDHSIEIATKWGYSYVADFSPNAKVHEVKDHSLRQLDKQWIASEKLLPYLTTLQIHSATFETGVLTNDRVLERLSELKAKHKISIGLTTTGSSQTEVIKAALEVQNNGTQFFDTYQVTYNVFDQSFASVANGLNGKRVIIKEALANGRIFRNGNYPAYKKVYSYLEALGNKYDVGVDAVALRFCMDSIDPFIVLSGASDGFQLDQNLMALTFELAQEEIGMLQSFAFETSSYWEDRKKLPWN
ncbi:Predicted oxidoreductase [Reichenbachiella faecimaris]|uniref:Predicted oxidoreductase n=1 Tax=Reichenbachiella faecimaris TaxID=692418 RepID=A0A1W2G515_REIFA|nr:aldo/keto reductase [Reichenbachiella faecimaris]SMD31765.1 Predicted oxidoreductase [Reichenbachiella faecimaris]